MNYKAIYQNLADDTDITNIVSTRIYHDAPPRDVTYPYIVFTKVTGDEVGAVEYATARYQLDLVGKLRGTNQSANLETLREAVIANLKNKRGTLGSSPNTQIVKGTEFAGERGLLLGDNQAKQISLDFLFHYLRA